MNVAPGWSWFFWCSGVPGLSTCRHETCKWKFQLLLFINFIWKISFSQVNLSKWTLAFIVCNMDCKFLQRICRAYISNSVFATWNTFLLLSLLQLELVKFKNSLDMELVFHNTCTLLQMKSLYEDINYWKWKSAHKNVKAGCFYTMKNIAKIFAIYWVCKYLVSEIYLVSLKTFCQFS